MVLGIGPSTGGGAYSITCPANPIEPAQTILLDLYEGESIYKFKMKNASGSIEKDYFVSVDTTYTLQGYPQMAESIKGAILNHLKEFFRSTVLVEHASELPVADDLGTVPIIPTQCQLAQAAYFDDNSGTIYILKSAWDGMDSMNRAALVQHELHYRFKRLAGEKSSNLTRKIVAHIFAQEGVTPVHSGASNTNRTYRAELEYSSIFQVLQGYQNAPMVRLQFNQINGNGLVSKTWADIPLLYWDLKYEYIKTAPYRHCVVKTPDVNFVTTVPLNGTLYSGEYSLRIEYITNKPVKIKIINPDGSILTEGEITGGKSC